MSRRLRGGLWALREGQRVLRDEASRAGRKGWNPWGPRKDGQRDRETCKAGRGDLLGGVGTEVGAAIQEIVDG